MAILLPDDACEYDTTTFRPGAIVHDRYEVISLLGHGTSGAVYKANDTRLHSTVALKHTLPAAEHARQAFAREAAILAELRHPSLAAVTDHFLDDAGQFLVMAFVPGDDLGARLRHRKKSFPLHEVLHWAKLLLDV
ncbi:MAG: protein kinase domain-containing protein, partial [Bacteroidales bacterium]